MTMSLPDGLCRGDRVLVAMSGGVDSSVAAALCKQVGLETVGVTLKLWGGAQDSGCCAVSDVDDARRVCQQLGIDHFVFNYADEFDKSVVGPYVDAHVSGLTPNPCVECNRHVKFDALLKRSVKLGFDRLVTGHHVRISDRSGRVRLRRGSDASKDQSYVLYMLSEGDLGHLWFPVGDYEKSDLRVIAGNLGLRTAAKAESQDVCFITAKRGRADFLGSRIGLHSADVVDMSGEVLGSVPSVELVTIGQRRGLTAGGSDRKLYAVDVNVADRTVTVGGRGDLLCDETHLVEHSWVSGAHSGAVLAQCSAHGTADSGVLDASGYLRWDEPHRKVAPGQSVVFYDGDEVIGGAIAARAF